MNRRRHREGESWLTTRLDFGAGLLARTSRFTPYLVLADINGAPILSLAITDRGFVVHRAAGVEDGAPLGPIESPE